MGISNSRNVFHDDFRGFGFSCATLSGYHDACILILLLKHSIGGISNGIHVWRILKKLSALVFRDEFIAVNVHDTIRVDRYRHLANIGVDFSCLISAKGKIF